MKNKELEHIMIVDNIKRAYTFKQPFNIFNKKEKILLVSKKDISELTDSGIDVVGLIYAPVGLGKTDFLKASSAGEKMLTFRTDSNQYIDIPESYVLIDKNTFEGVEYISNIMAFKLAPLPITEDLDVLKTEIEEYINGRLGISCKSELIPTSARTVINKDEAALNEIEREQNKKDTTLYTKYIECIAKNQRMKTFIDKLTSYYNDTCD